MKVIIDRFEENIAVCEKENREMLDIEKSKLPSNAKEGDILIIDDGKITVDKEATKNRAKKINNLMDELFK